MPAEIAFSVANLRADIRVFADLDALSHAAAAEFVKASQNAASERGRFLVALSGGDTPAKLYALLTRAPYREQIDWDAVQVFWGDERCVPPDDAQNNYKQAFDALLGKVPVPPHNIHRIRSELDPQKAAQDYEGVLKRYSTSPLEWPRFDLALLGLGEDGHTASLFPGSDVDASRPVLAASGNYQDRPAWRVTLTPLVFNSARSIIFLVSGSEKAGILADVLCGDYRPESLPAQRICQTEADSVWMLDRAAAAGLPGDARTKEE
jgi:6-phosphogluconolactonase